MKKYFNPVKFSKSTITSLLMLLSITSIAQTKAELRARLDSFFSSPAYTDHLGMTNEDLKGIPKYDRPDLAAEQDFYMTLDPNTMTVPSNVKYDVMQMVDSINGNQSLDYAAITGVNWDERGPNNVGGRTRGIMFDPTDAANGYKKVWAGGVAGGLWYNNDITSLSTAWSSVDDFWANMAVTSIAYDPTDDSTFYVGTGEGWFNVDAVRGQGIWKSEDAGQTWTQLASTDNSTFYFVQKLIVTPTGRLVVATTSSIMYSDDGGNTWTTALAGVFADLELSQNGDLYASTGNTFSAGNIMKSTNNGTTWGSILPPGAGIIRRVELACAPSNANILYAIAGNTSGNIAWFQRSDDAGSTWTNLAVPRYLNDTSIDFTRGQSWYDLILAVHPTNPAIVLAGGIDLHKSTDFGASWDGISHWFGGFNRPEVHADQHAIAFRPGDNNAALFGNDGGTYYSPDVGNSATPSYAQSVNGYNVTQFYSVAMENVVGSNYMLAGAQDNGSHRFTSPGINSTTEVTGGDGAFCFIDQDDSRYQLTSFIRNNWRRSANRGDRFTNITSDNSGRFINPADYDDDADILYAASGSNQIYRITGITGLTSPSIVTVGGDALGGIQATHFRCSPYSNNIVFVGNSRGNVFRVSNAHTSPVSVNIDPNNHLPAGYISCIEVGASDNQLLVTYSNYNVNSVWETLNGGTTWQSKEGDLPNIPVRWALYNPNDRSQVMLATEVGVWTTDNLRATNVEWAPSNTGLANVRCDMLQIRASDNLIAIATHGRGVFTTDIFGDTTISASFISDKDDICIGNSVEFQNTSSGNYTSNKWTITPNTITYLNGTSSSSINPEVQFNAAGTYTVKLVSSSISGANIDSVSISNAILVNPGIPLSNWTQNFDNIVTAPAVTVDAIWSLEYENDYAWLIDSNGTPSTGTGPFTDYSGTGHYLYAEASPPASSGDIAIIETKCLDMLDNGTFTFSYHMYGQDIGRLTLDADTGTGWFHLLQIVGEQNINATAPWNKETYDLSNLKNTTAKIRLAAVRGPGFNGDIAIDELSFEQGAACEISGFSLGNDRTSQCGGSVLLSAGNYASYIWNTGATTSSINVTATGTYYVTVTNGNGCTATDSINVTILNLPNVNLGADVVQCGGSVQLSAGNFTSYNWSTGARTSSINVSNSGNYSVTVTDANGCRATDLINITIHNPIMDFLIDDTSLCEGDVIDAEEGSNYTWNTGSTGRQETVTVSGDYFVTKLDNNGCQTSDTVNISVIDLPIASFTFEIDTELPDGFNIDFTNNSTNADSYHWTFGDGDTSIIMSPSHIYSLGSYTARLIVYNECGSDTIEQLIAHTAGIDETASDEVSIYPNPANEKLFVTNTSGKNIDELQIYDLKGQLVLTSSDTNKSSLEIDITSLSKGTYYASISSNETKVIKKIVVIK